MINIKEFHNCLADGKMSYRLENPFSEVYTIECSAIPE